MKNQAVKASALYLFGNICTKAIAFITIPIFTRLLNTGEYGIVNTYTSWVHIASIVVTLSLYNSFRMAYVEKKEDFESYCASILRLGVVFFLISMLLSVIAVFVFPSLKPISWMIYCCMIQSFGTFCVTAMSTKSMLEFQYNRRAFYMIVPNVACAALAVVLLYTFSSERYIWRILSYVIVYAIFAIIALWTTRKGKTKVKYWKYGINYSLPLIFHGLSLVVLSSSDRIMITSIVGTSESGVYSLVYNLGTIAMAVTTSLEGVWIPWFIRKLKTNNIDEINKKAKYLIENITVVVIGVMLVAPEVLQIMAPEEYWSGKTMIFPIVVASYVMFLYDLAVNVEYQFKATKKIAINTMIAATINIVLNLIFIPLFGAIAAAYTTVVAYLFSMLMHYYYAKKYVPRIFPFKKYYIYFLAVIIMAVVGVFMVDMEIIRWVLAVVLGVGYCYAMFAKKRLISLQINMNEKE